MNTQQERLTITTTASGPVTASAIRLVLAGYLGKLRHLVERNEHVVWTIPSETRRGVEYTLDFNQTTGTLTCSCPAGTHGKPCKHFRLFQLQLGIGATDVAA